MPNRRQVVDPGLLPHERPCQCRACKATYRAIYHSRPIPVFSAEELSAALLSQVCAVHYGECSNPECGKCWIIKPGTSTKRKYCDTECRHGHWLAVYTVCSCGSGITGNRKNLKLWEAKLCVECRRAKWRMKDRKKKGLPATTDKYLHTHCACGAELQHRTNKPRRVCDDCRSKSWTKRAGYGKCAGCSKDREPERRSQGFRLCQECADERRRASNRRKNVRRRAARRLSSDHFTMADIGERDGWRCHLCHRKVNRKLSGMHPDGPTIDHLVPLSFGGEDTLDNVALAHRKCNLERNNSGPAQLRLLG